MERRKTTNAAMAAMAARRLRGMGVRARYLASRLTRRLGLSLALLVVICTGTLAQFAAVGLGVAPVASAHAVAPSGQPNLYDPHRGTTSITHPNLAPGKGPQRPAGPPQSIPRSNTFPMATGFLTLAPGKATRFVGSDGRLEVDVPAGAITQADVDAASGALQLRISQIAPASGSNAGGSGLVSFGTYLIQVVDGNGVLARHGLRQPATLKLHEGNGDSALDLTKVVSVFNGALPDDIVVAPTTQPAPVHTRPGVRPGAGGIDAPAPEQVGPVTAASIGLGIYHAKDAQYDAAGHTLIVQDALANPSTSLSWNTDSAVSSFGKPDPFNVDLNAGALTAGFPIDVPSGPGGLTPPITLNYSSASVSEQHSPQGAASWVGEGWDLSLGSISWAEHNTTVNCSGCGNGWEDSWQLSDPFGTSAELIPPNITTATYFEDSTNSVSGEPIQWQTATDTHAKIFSYKGGLTVPDDGITPPCFRVFLTNGIMEEFGCTQDSLEYYYGTGHDYLSSWNLDLITDPEGNQIHLTYWQDMETKTVGGKSHDYIRDAVLKTIEWDSPTCYGSNQAGAPCLTTGSAQNGTLWAPLVRVFFDASNSVTRLTGNPTGNTNCNTGHNLRCDDPKDLSGSGGLGAPDVQSDFVLNDIDVQVCTSACTTPNSANWSTQKDYQLSYEQSGPATNTDPTTGLQEYMAGVLDLTKLQEVSGDQSVSLPTRTFTYATHEQYYEDDIYHPNGGCGPSWNTGNGSGCLLWSQQWDGNDRFMASADNGMGLTQTFTWADARNNTHGVNSGGNNWDPLFCDFKNTYPCNEADDQNWSREVLASQTDTVWQSSYAGSTQVQSTTN